MRKLISVLFLILIGIQAQGQETIFEQTNQKRWSDYNVDDTGFYTDNQEVGITVFLSNSQSQPEYVTKYEDRIPVSELAFDSELGQSGAIIEKRTHIVCAYKQFFRFKPTENCKIEMVDDSQTYTVKMKIKSTNQ